MESTVCAHPGAQCRDWVIPKPHEEPHMYLCMEANWGVRRDEERSIGLQHGNLNQRAPACSHHMQLISSVTHQRIGLHQVCQQCPCSPAQRWEGRFELASFVLSHEPHAVLRRPFQCSPFCQQPNQPIPISITAAASGEHAGQ